MTGNKGMLTRVLLVLIAVFTITPTFYAHALEDQSNGAHNSNEKHQLESEDSDKAEHANTAAENKVLRIKTACVKVRASISNRTANLQQRTERHLGVIDKVYANITAYSTSHSLVITDVDKQNVNTARSAAALAVQDLAHNEDALNCEDTNAGQAAAALRITVQSVNDTMRSYRKAVGNILTAVKAQIVDAEGGTDENGSL